MRSIQRQFQEPARRLSLEAESALRPLHDDIIGHNAQSEQVYDGIVYFSVDHWHKNQASAVMAIQPDQSDSERYAFYHQSIEKRRVDLGATALGDVLLNPPQERDYRLSRMNLDHITWTEPVAIEDQVVGGLQAAFSYKRGRIPDPSALQGLMKHYQQPIQEVGAAFSELSSRVESIGDTLELLPPATPNAYIISWDLNGSTDLAAHSYGALRNYLLDTKNLFQRIATDRHAIDSDDTGDGQNIVLWLPDYIDKANSGSIRSYLEADILPLIHRMQAEHQGLIPDYFDIKPEIRFAIGLASVENDKHDQITSPEFWEIARILKQNKTAPIIFTDAVRDLVDN